jgi:hypothetical protein
VGSIVSRLLATCSRWFLADFSTLKMEAIRSSETSVHTRSTLRYIPEDGILHSHRCEDLKSYEYLLVYSRGSVKVKQNGKLLRYRCPCTGSFPFELLQAGLYLKSEGIITAMEIISVLVYKMENKTDCRDYPGISLFFFDSYSIRPSNCLPYLTPLVSEIIGAFPAY